jgi:hypothetical protein
MCTLQFAQLGGTVPLPPTLLQITGFSTALRGAALQQRAGSRRAPAAPQPVQAATLQTRRLKVGERAPKPPPPPPRKVAPAGGTVRIGGTKTIGGSKTTAGGTKVVGGTRKVTAIEVFSSEKQFRQKQQGNAKPVPRVLR